ncbi:MAG: MmgE/PrpD family protein [Fervidicoccaceae archaeon]
MGKGKLRELLDNAAEIAERANFREHKAALTSLIDTISIAMASHSIDSRVKKLREILLQNGSGRGDAIVFGERMIRVDDTTALVLNSFAAHSLELDDWLPLGILHPGASIIPSAVLLAQKKDLSLEEITAGIIYGYQIAEEFGRWLGRSHYRTWHNTSTVAGVAVAAMLSWIDEREDDSILSSMLLAITYAGGFMPLINRLVVIKPMSPAHASLVGYYSYMMSEAFTSLSRETYDVEEKICSILSKQCENNPQTEREPAVLRIGYKIFPTCRNSHTTIQASLKLSNQVDLNNIDSIELEVFEEASEVADVVSPSTLEEAMFSLTFLTATALVKKWVGLKEIFESLSDPLVREIEKKVRVRVREDYTAYFPKKHPVTVRVKMKNGTVLEEHEDIPYGDPSKTLTEDVLYEKLRSLSQYSGNRRILKFIDLTLKNNNNMKINQLFREVYED